MKFGFHDFGQSDQKPNFMACFDFSMAKIGSKTSKLTGSQYHNSLKNIADFSLVLSL